MLTGFLFGWYIFASPPLGQTPKTGQPAAAAVAPLWLGDPGVDVEKARARRREQAEAVQRWERTTTLGDYERIGSKEPRWEADARACLDAYAQALADRTHSQAVIATAKAACQRAVAAGCEDPLVLYAGLRLGLYFNTQSFADEARVYARVEANLDKSGYSPIRKCYASFRAAEIAWRVAASPPPEGYSPPSLEGTDVDASLERAVSHLVELLLDPTVSRDSVYKLADELGELAQKDDHGREHFFVPMERAFVSGALKDAKETASLRLMEGMFWVQYAWQARGGEWSKDVSDEEWQLFAERLAKADTALTKAYALDPTDPHICFEMMSVELGQGRGRERLETWFRRAMDADPDNYAACKNKLLYLAPKWYGDADSGREFGRQCLATGNWSARLPFILLDAHLEVAPRTVEQTAYWKQPEVWKDVQDLFEGALTFKPDSVPDMSAYALYAFRAEKWELANRLFETLGERFDSAGTVQSRDQLRFMRRVAAGHVQKK